VKFLKNIYSRIFSWT